MIATAEESTLIDQSQHRISEELSIELYTKNSKISPTNLASGVG